MFRNGLYSITEKCYFIRIKKNLCSSNDHTGIRHRKQNHAQNEENTVRQENDISTFKEGSGSSSKSSFIRLSLASGSDNTLLPSLQAMIQLEASKTLALVTSQSVRRC